MPTGPAARVTDRVEHELPGVLTPGPGSPNTLIGGLPAWRGLLDRHECHHGTGVVIDGSPTVVINGFPACRQGDTVLEASGWPNRIMSGCQSVIIGNTPVTGSTVPKQQPMSSVARRDSEDPFEKLHHAIEQGAVDAIAEDIAAGRMAAAYVKSAAAGLTLTLLPSSREEAAVGIILSVIGFSAVGKLGSRAFRLLSGGLARRRGIDLVASRFGSKIQKQMEKRGWTSESVEAVINNPHRKVARTDTRWRSDGTRASDPATAYINEDGSYVVRNDVTGDIVQVSDRTDPNWSSPF